MAKKLIDSPEKLADEVLSSPKYRRMKLPRETVMNIIHQLQEDGWKGSDLDRQVRLKLHHLTAPYLGDLQGEVDYSGFGKNEPLAAYQPLCSALLAQHTSTRERLQLLETFYAHLFEITGKPSKILDLACGLNPFSLPWMPGAETIEYHAYDIIEPRLMQIDRFFTHTGLKGTVHLQDILLQAPGESADAVFLFKEIHRMEDRKKGSVRGLLEALQAPWLLVSLPTRNLTGSRNLLDLHRRLIASILSGLSWPVTEVLFSNEVVFVIRK